MEVDEEREEGNERLSERGEQEEEGPWNRVIEKG